MTPAKFEDGEPQQAHVQLRQEQESLQVTNLAFVVNRLGKDAREPSQMDLALTLKHHHQQLQCQVLTFAQVSAESFLVEWWQHCLRGGRLDRPISLGHLIAIRCSIIQLKLRELLRLLPLAWNPTAIALSDRISANPVCRQVYGGLDATRQPLS